MYLNLQEETADIGSRQELSDLVSLFRALDVKDQLKEVSAQLHILCRDRNLPCFVDRGGILEDLGEYKETFVGLIDEFLAADEDHYLAFIHRRKPCASASTA